MGWLRKNSQASPSRESPPPPYSQYASPNSYSPPPQQSYSYNNNSSFHNEAALMISKSESILSQIRHKYPNLLSLFAYNREGTIGFLKANGGLFAFSLSSEFHVPHEGNDNYKAWSDYKLAIEKYLEGICANVKAKDPHTGAERTFNEELRQARSVLSNEIHQKHYLRFPYWPATYNEQTSYVDLKTGDIYDTGAYTMVWSCNGWITVIDKRPDANRYIAEFQGKPDIKLLVLDHDRLRKLENTVTFEGIEKAKTLVGDSKYLRLTWDQLK